MAAVANWPLLTSVLGFLSGEPHSTANADAYIRSLLPEQRLEFIVRYSASAWIYSKFMKFRQPPLIYIHCKENECDPSPLRILDDLHSRAPDAYGARVSDPEAAQIELYVDPEPTDFDKRDRDIDKKLHLDAHIGSRFLYPSQAAPCRTTVYFDRKRAALEKAMIFIDRDASPRMQDLCMGFELVRAIGVVNLPSPLFYQELETRFDYDPVPYLAANAFLHRSPDIQAGDPMEKALAVFKDRYGVK
jgi:hypothetical protein